MPKTVTLPRDLSNVASVETQKREVMKRNMKAKDFDPTTGEIRKVADIVADIHQEQTAQSNFAYYDPLEAVMAAQLNDTAKIVVASSMLWSLQARIANKVKAFYFNAKKHAFAKEALETGTIDAFNNLRSLIADAHASDELFSELGYDNYREDTTSLQAHMRLYRGWSTTVEQAAKAAGQQFREPNITEMFENPPPLEASRVDKEVIGAKIMMQLEGATEDEIGKAETLVRSKLQAEYLEELKQSKALAPTFMSLYTAFTMKTPVNEPIAFSSLPVMVQRGLLDASVRACDKAATTLAKYRSVSVLDYAAAIPQLRRAKTELTTVLAIDRLRIID